MNLQTSTNFKGAALAVSLISEINIPCAFASNYQLQGAICKSGGDPSISLVSKDGKFAIDLATGGKNKVGLVVNGLANNPISVKDLDVKSPITAVFGSIDKGTMKYGGLFCKISIRNDVGTLVVPTCRVSASQFDINRGGTVPLVRVGDSYSATFPSSIITSLGKEVPRLK